MKNLTKQWFTTELQYSNTQLLIVCIIASLILLTLISISGIVILWVKLRKECKLSLHGFNVHYDTLKKERAERLESEKKFITQERFDAGVKSANELNTETYNKNVGLINDFLNETKSDLTTLIETKLSEVPPAKVEAVESKTEFKKDDWVTKKWDDGDIDIFQIKKVESGEIFNHDGTYYRNGELVQDDSFSCHTIGDTSCLLSLATPEEIQSVAPKSEVVEPKEITNPADLKTDEERLEYAKKHYYEGVTFKSALVNTVKCTAKHEPVLNSIGNIGVNDNGVNGIVYSKKTGRWATIISTPSPKETETVWIPLNQRTKRYKAKQLNPIKESKF